MKNKNGNYLWFTLVIPSLKADEPSLNLSLHLRPRLKHHYSFLDPNSVCNDYKFVNTSGQLGDIDLVFRKLKPIKGFSCNKPPPCIVKFDGENRRSRFKNNGKTIRSSISVSRYRCPGANCMNGEVILVGTTVIKNKVRSRRMQVDLSFH